jgi:hypothetical protein
LAKSIGVAYRFNYELVLLFLARGFAPFAKMLFETHFGGAAISFHGQSAAPYARFVPISLGGRWQASATGNVAPPVGSA